MSSSAPVVTVDPSLTHYVELALLPDPEFPASQLMNALYAKLHRALCDVRANNPAGSGIGLSFPRHQEGVRRSLGSVIRLHGSDTALDELMALHWLKGMRDHLEQPQPELLKVPDIYQGHRVVRRVQIQSSAERLRRRLVKRHPGQVDAEEALRRIPDEAAERTSLPYVQLHSRSTDQHFFLFVQHGPLQPEPLLGGFNAYGMSQQGATVPWF